MTELKTISGEIEGWGNNIREFSNKQRGSRGIKIEGNWHNIVDKIETLQTLNNIFPKGSFVTFTEKQNTRGYWDIVGEIKAVDKKEMCNKTVTKDKSVGELPPVQSKRPNLSVPIKNETSKNILLQVCFKAAVEFTKEIMTQTDNAIDFDIETCTGELTRNLYKKVKEVKQQLIKTEKW